MFCRTCDYPLWNLKTNRCPECGEGFDWRDYQFKPDSVSLSCPTCGHARTDLQILAPLTTVTCEVCGQNVPVETMTVAPLTNNPWDAIALQDYPAPPFKLYSTGFWWLVVLTIIELPGVAVAFLPIDFMFTPWALIVELPNNNKVWPLIPFLAGLLVTAGSLRTLLPWRWTRVELVAAWLAIVAMLGLPLITATMFAVDTFMGGGRLDPHEYPVFIIPFCLPVVLASSILLQWRWRVPHVYVTQMSFRAVFMSGPVICLLLFGLEYIGPFVTLYLVIVYGIVLVVGHLLLWRMTRRRRQYLRH